VCRQPQSRQLDQVDHRRIAARFVNVHSR
jgi:hypothetical protein